MKNTLSVAVILTAVSAACGVHPAGVSHKLVWPGVKFDEQSITTNADNGAVNEVPGLYGFGKPSRLTGDVPYVGKDADGNRCLEWATVPTEDYSGGDAWVLHYEEDTTSTSNKGYAVWKKLLSGGAIEYYGTDGSSVVATNKVKFVSADDSATEVKVSKDESDPSCVIIKIGVYYK